MKSVLLIGNFLSKSVFTLNISEPVGQYLEQEGWQVLRTSTHRSGVVRGLDMLLQTLRQRERYALACIEVYSGRAFLWAEACGNLLSRLKKPFALALHGGGLAQFDKNHPGRLSRLMNKAAAVVTPSRFLMQAFREIYPQMHYLPNGIPLDNYPFQLRTGVRPRLVWLRAFEQKTYNPLMAVQVLEIVRARYPTLRLSMIGPDKGDGSLQAVERQAHLYGLGQALEIIHGIPNAQVPEHLAQADIFLNTTNLESFGVSAMEAAACGLCVVSTDAGELSHLWQDGEDALLVPCGDAPAMAAAVQRLLREPELAERLSRNARRKAEGYDQAVILPQWQSLFEEILENAAPA